MSMRAIAIALLGGLGAVACQTAPAPNSGFLSSYEGLTPREDSLRASIRERRDDAAVAQLTGLYLEPAVLAADVAEVISQAEAQMMLGEIDRQLCFELSNRFPIATDASDTTGRVRTQVTRVKLTNTASSVASAAAKFFIPGPIGVRAPGTTGGLSVESELLSPDGTQAAALAWSRDANVVGTDDPSLSRIGDALQFASTFGDHAARSFTPADQPRYEWREPDPCARFGSRSEAGKFVTGLVTGLYVPQAAGVRSGEPSEEATPPAED